MLLGIPNPKIFYDFNRQLNSSRNGFYNFFRLKYECCGTISIASIFVCGLDHVILRKVWILESFSDPHPLTTTRNVCNYALKDVEIASSFPAGYSFG